ncbi:unnamed protein product (macronuclear) [Paramecium tetraurelia]|uniref:chitin synthase n=1 Tax=Paramecium tetraurelia TaxID=5888 RepID=A0CKG1_PARTE|nr:uncharacterized protein GSPATT00000992001 [Paramecium tetraurelia]CAK71278.1 unnamed protein product [Paramecium tetraurelia]|eukprot:XP_001438675.1 hypothetical protein (macronuclear) [Paramecium tetraurelia strain d4-2]
MKHTNTTSFGRTMEFIRKISDYRSRYQPLELQLQKNGGLQKQIFYEENGITKVHSTNISIKGIGSLRKAADQTVKNESMMKQSQVMKIDHEGLISEIIFLQNKDRRKTEIEQFDGNQQKEIEEFCRENPIKVMICITMYSEPLSELQKSLQGIQESLQEFYENDILPQQIVVVVIYDGIENIRNQADENNNNQEGDIIPYFCQYLDKQNNIEVNQTLEYQYLRYKFKKELIQKYSLEQRKLFQEKPDQLKSIYQDKYLRNEIKQQQQNENDLQAIIKIMEEQHRKAVEYVKLRQDNALVYQNVQKIKLPNKDEEQMPIFHVFKFANGTKLSSHLWFFKGFCHEFKPEYCVLMDCGARPQKGSVYNLVKELIDNDQVGGACGKMTIELSKTGNQKDEYMDILTELLSVNIFNIERCQKCEYDIGNLLDKQFESALNFIQVLPGAYSAYRYKAFSTKYKKNTEPEINNSQQVQANNEQEVSQNENILDYYLKSKLDHNYEHATLEEANMFLAEDRVLCLYLFCNGYYLRYVRDALVEVDPPQTMIQLLLQRRRWINGSFFALNYVIKKFGELLPNSGHSRTDQYLFIICLVFARISQAMQYSIISLQMVWLYMILNTLTETLEKVVAAAIKQAVMGSYGFLIFCLIYLSLNYNPSSVNMISKKDEKEEERHKINSYFFSKFYGISTLLGLFSIFNAGITIYLFIEELIINLSPFNFFQYPQDLPSYVYFIVLLSIILTILPFLLQICIDRKLVIQIAINSIHYVYYMPTYTHLFITYSFCRIDDLTWGTKGLTQELENKDQNNRESNKKYQKAKFLVKWIFWNVALVLTFYLLFSFKIQNIIIIIVLALGVTFSILQLAKFFGYFKFWIKLIISKKESNNQVHNFNEQQQIVRRKTKKERSIKQKEYTKALYQPFPQDEGQSQTQ